MALDADSLFVNPIDFHFSDREDADIVLFCDQIDKDVPLKRKVKNGTIVVRPSERISRFMEEVQSDLYEVFARNTVSWYIDQEVFARKLLDWRLDLVVGHVCAAYADWEFKGTSIIWAAKGTRKQEDIRYHLMMQLLSDRRPVHIELGQHDSGRMIQSSSNSARVAIFLPRLDLPWKSLAEDALVPRIKEDNVSLRLHWKHFAICLANSLERKGVSTDIHEVPAPAIKPAAIDRMGYRLAFVPHRCNLNFEQGKTKILYFMQEYFRWVFVVDKKGWSASSSVYPVDIAMLPLKEDHAFDTYRRKLYNGELVSKFDQTVRKSRLKLALSGEIPFRKYVFFPLQIPHDQSIRYFSQYSEEDVVRAVLDWSHRSGVPVVFKPHPVSQKEMVPFAEMVRAGNAYWSTAHVQALIEHASAIFTINSGVGFEALLQLKPVVTFGKAEYDCVSFKTTLDTIDEAWRDCLRTPANELERRYRIFVDWFLSSHAVDISRPRQMYRRLDAIADTVLEEIS